MSYGLPERGLSEKGKKGGGGGGGKGPIPRLEWFWSPVPTYPWQQIGNTFIEETVIIYAI